MSHANDNNPQTADQLTAVTGVHLMQGIGHKPAEGFWTEAWRQVFKRPGAVLGIAWVGIIAFFAIFAPLIANGHPILVVDQAGVNPLGKLLSGIGPALVSGDGLRLLFFTILWSLAWIATPRRLPMPVLVALAGFATLVFTIRFSVLYFTGVETSGAEAVVSQVATDEPIEAQVALNAKAAGGFIFQIVTDLAALTGLAWAAAAFNIDRRVRIATTPVIVVAYVCALLGMAAGADPKLPVTSPMLEYLSVVDLALLVGGVAGVLLLVPRWWGSRGDRAKALLVASLQAGLTIVVHSFVSGRATSRDQSEWMRAMTQHPSFEVLAAFGIAALVAVPFVVVYPFNKTGHRVGASGLIGLALFGLLAAQWSTPLPQFEYRAKQTRGEISAVYTIIPWSPTQSGTAVDLLDPGSNVFSQILKGLEDVTLSDRSLATRVRVRDMPLDEETLAAIRTQLGFAAATLPMTPDDAFEVVQLAAAEDPDLTVAGAVRALERQRAPAYLLGTDSGGRDMLSQLLHACRLSISIGLVSTTIAVFIGVTIGALMGYFGGWVDMLLYRVVEVFMAIPLLFLLIVAAAVLPRNTYVMMAIIGCVTWTGSARFIRAEFYKLRNQDFVQSARAVGLPLRSVLFKHMLPNGVTPVLVDASFAIAAAILAEAVLSYLGLSDQDQASWGRLLSDANNQVGEFMWWLAIFPGFAIFLTVLSYNLIGEALRDAIDPKLKKARV